MISPSTQMPVKASQESRPVAPASGSRGQICEKNAFGKVLKAVEAGNSPQNPTTESTEQSGASPASPSTPDTVAPSAKGTIPENADVRLPAWDENILAGTQPRQSGQASQPATVLPQAVTSPSPDAPAQAEAAVALSETPAPALVLEKEKEQPAKRGKASDKADAMPLPIATGAGPTLQAPAETTSNAEETATEPAGNRIATQDGKLPEDIFPEKDTPLKQVPDSKNEKTSFIQKEAQAPLPEQKFSSEKVSFKAELQKADPKTENAPILQTVATHNTNEVQTASGVKTAQNSAVTHQTPVEQAALHIARAAEGRIEHMVINLKPEELGKIEIHLDFGKDNAVQTTVAATRPETLDLLRRDAVHLQRVLQDAGLQTTNQNLNFTLRHENSQGFGQSGQFQTHTNPDSSESAAGSQPAIRENTSTLALHVADGRVDMMI